MAKEASFQKSAGIIINQLIISTDEAMYKTFNGFHPFDKITSNIMYAFPAHTTYRRPPHFLTTTITAPAVFHHNMYLPGQLRDQRGPTGASKGQSADLYSI